MKNVGSTVAFVNQKMIIDLCLANGGLSKILVSVSISECHYNFRYRVGIVFIMIVARKRGKFAVV